MNTKLVLLTSLCLFLSVSTRLRAHDFKAGAYSVDISPKKFPVRVNAMFTERSADQVVDPLFAKAIVLESHETKIALCVVDSCMVPRDLIDQAKETASKATHIPIDRMLVSATHTHSAPSAMGCLGSRVDPEYAAMLPARISEAIIGAAERLQIAKVGWAQMDDWDHTFNRRWIRRPDRLLLDPFGETNVRAHMHPGYESPDVTGPSGPVDPQLSVLAFRSADGKPLALLANYSQHYYGSALVSSDYYGRFARHISKMLGADENFVAIMSQGTSGDLMWMDYSAPPNEIGYDAYAKEIAQNVANLISQMTWRAETTLRMAEQKLEFNYRTPDAKRLKWAKDLAAKLGDKLPQAQAEIYALESIYLHERPRTELKVQGIQIGSLGITALPNEVFCISGLKIKAKSPFAATFNIELANGAEGYIPPPEQHKLGGYTTWAARTAGLETGAEPQIVETALQLLEQVSRRSRNSAEIASGAYASAILASKPEGYWRFEDIAVPVLRDTMQKHHATIEGGVALYLPGADQRIGFSPTAPPGTNQFSGQSINRSAHFAGGRVRGELTFGQNYSLEMWIWNGLPADARPVTGYLFSRGADGDKTARGEHLGIGGADGKALAGKLILSNGNERNDLLVGRTLLGFRKWHHLVLIRQGDFIRLHLDGNESPEIAGKLPLTTPPNERTFFLGGRNDNTFNLEGKLDEAAAYNRALSPKEIARHYQLSGLAR